MTFFLTPLRSVTAGLHGRSWAVARLLSLILIAGVLAGCGLFSDRSIDASITGTVTDNVGAPIAGATMTATFPESLDLEPLTTTTNDDGQYAFSFTVDEDASLSLVVRARLSDILIGTRDVNVSETTPNQADINFVLASSGPGGPDLPSEPSRESGTVSRIVLVEQSRTVLRVQEGGGPETASLTFVAIDSIGRRLASNQSVPVTFSLGQNPGAGVAVNPTSTETNALGQATVVVASGTRSGVVQVIAEAPTADGGTVRSDPVRLTIHGGLPAQERFTVGPTRRNIPGLLRSNEETSIEAIVGDRYGNPVVPGTSVYFTSTNGVVGGSLLTSEQGTGGVILRSGNPLPLDDGIVIVNAETAGRDGERVTGDAVVIFTGRTTVSLDPQSVGLGSYELTVDDPNGNPLVGGSTVSVAVEGSGIEVTGYTATLVPETDVFVVDANGDGVTQKSEVTVITGLGITEFPFLISEDPDSGATPNVKSIKVVVTSENGNLDFTLNASGASTASNGLLQVASPDATVTRTATGLTVTAGPRAL